MKQLLLTVFLILNFTSCESQESIIVSKIPIDWKDYPHVYTSYDASKFIHEFSFLETVDIYEITYTSDSHNIQSFAAIPKKKGKYPVIIYNRGGNRNFAALSLFREPKRYPIVHHFSKLASEGYIVIGCNYRGSGKSEGKDEFGGKDVNDLLNLIEAIKEIPEADTSKIGMYGWSRGGMMTYLALTKTNQIKAAVVGGAPSDNTIIDRPELEKRVFAELIPNYWEHKETELKKRSAVFWADQFPKDVPILMLHGNNDWRVKSTHSLRLALEFEKHRVPYRLKIFEGGDHGLSSFRDEVHQDVVSWFNRFLKQKENLPNMKLPEPKD